MRNNLALLSRFQYYLLIILKGLTFWQVCVCVVFTYVAEVSIDVIENRTWIVTVAIGLSRRFRRISTVAHSLMSEHSDPAWTCPATVTAGENSCGRSCRSDVWTCGGTWLTDSGWWGIAAPPMSKHPDLGCTRAPTVLAAEGPDSRLLCTCWVFPACSTIFKVDNELDFVLVQWAMTETAPFRSMWCRRIPS